MALETPPTEHIETVRQARRRRSLRSFPHLGHDFTHHDEPAARNIERCLDLGSLLEVQHERVSQLFAVPAGDDRAPRS